MSDASRRLQAIATELTRPEQILDALKGPPQPRPEQPHPFVAPRTQTEARLAALWAEALGLEAVGVDDDFFALGGHSLMVTHLLSRIRDGFGVELPLNAVFTEAMTVAELAKQIEVAQIRGAGAPQIAAVLDAVARMSDRDVEATLAGHGKP